MPTEITVALIGAVIAAIGWLVLHALSRIQDDRRRSLEKHLAYIERQIEELYGPLFNLVHQVFLANSVQEAILAARSPDGNARLTQENAQRVQSHFHDQYFHRLHSAINDVLRSKLHLVHGSRVPPSFSEYMRHALQEREQFRLWREQNVDTSFVEGVPWPDNFYDDIESGFELAMRRHEEVLQGLRRK